MFFVAVNAVANSIISFLEVVAAFIFSKLNFLNLKFFNEPFKASAFLSTAKLSDVKKLFFKAK
ncbi:hypothetical protein D3C80_1941380 [compost metagenome]